MGLTAHWGLWLVFFHLILTGRCNLECRYCFGEASDDFQGDDSGLSIDYDLPSRISYDVGDLAEFCRKDPDCVLTFYGGEPLLCLDDIKEIMDSVPARHFMMQTNGLLLNGLEPRYLNRFHTILVSIDGEEAVTDYFRGRGTYRRVIGNLRPLKENGFGGELIARMTVMEPVDVFAQVRWLVENQEFPFGSVHWQLNAGFWKDDVKRSGFEDWIERSYNPGVQRLARYWVDQMEGKGRVLKMYPFLGIAGSFLSEEGKALLRCGGGWVNYAIQTDGNIIACPTMWGIRDHYLGHIRSSDPNNLEKVFVGEPCTACEIIGICGGRCLYTNIAKRWGPDRYELVCRSVRNLVNAIVNEMPRIRRLIGEGLVRAEDFSYLRYNGCEIIP